MSHIFRQSFCFIAASWAAIALAQEPISVEHLQGKYPNTRFDWVKPSPVPGLAEVKMGKNFAYVDASGQYFLFGHLFDMKKRVDLTAKAIEAASPKLSWTDLPTEDAIVFGSNDAAHKLAVFTDPDCPFCRRIETELSVLQSQHDIQIFVFPYPIAQLHEQAKNIAKRILCSQDPQAAWRDYLISHKKPANTDQDCPKASAIDRNIALAERFAIVATPTLVAADGRMQSGAADAQALFAWLTKQQPTASEGAR